MQRSISKEDSSHLATPAPTKTQNTTSDISDFAIYYFYKKPEFLSDNETKKTWGDINEQKRKEIKREWNELSDDQKEEFKLSLYSELKWEDLSDNQKNLFKTEYQRISQKLAQKALGGIAINPIAVSSLPQVKEEVQVPMLQLDYVKKPIDSHFFYLSSLYRDFNDAENNFNIEKIISPPKPLSFEDRGKNRYIDARIDKWGRELSKFGIDRQGAESKEINLKNIVII